MKPIAKYVSDENVLFVGLFAIGIGYTIFTPWGGIAESAALMEAQYCIGSIFIFGIGFPITQALVLSLFSKLLGPIQQVHPFLSLTRGEKDVEINGTIDSERERERERMSKLRQG